MGLINGKYPLLIQSHTNQSVKAFSLLHLDLRISSKQLSKAIKQQSQLKHCNNESLTNRLPHGMNLVTAKMGFTNGVIAMTMIMMTDMKFQPSPWRTDSKISISKLNLAMSRTIQRS